MCPNTPVGLRQLAGFFLAHGSLVHQVAFVPAQDDVRTLAVGVNLQLTCQSTRGELLGPHTLATEVQRWSLGVEAEIDKQTGGNSLVCSYI